MTLRQVRFDLGTVLMSTTQVFPFRIPWRTMSPVSFLEIIHFSEVKFTELPLSQNLEILSRLCCKFLTKSTLSIAQELDLPTFPLVMISPFMLSPKVTIPPSQVSSERNFDLSPVMCLQHPLSRYHELFPLTRTCKANQLLASGTQSSLGSLSIMHESYFLIQMRSTQILCALLCYSILAH